MAAFAIGTGYAGRSRREFSHTPIRMLFTAKNQAFTAKGKPAVGITKMATGNGG
jgi:hypothetical protein